MTFLVDLLAEATLDHFVELVGFMEEWLTGQFSQSNVIDSFDFESKTMRSLCVEYKF